MTESWLPDGSTSLVQKLARLSSRSRCAGSAASKNPRHCRAIMPIVTSEQQLVEEITYFKGKAPNLECWISEPGGLTQFGAFVHVLQPDTRSSIKHWHSDEDELVYVLEGELTVVEGNQESVLHAGDAATFKAGVAVGHFLWNRSARPAKCLVVGTRAATDRVTYPDHDRLLHRDRSQPEDLWTDLQGRPASDPYAD
jgi:uncharacterized cupin superfamily protein